MLTGYVQANYTPSKRALLCLLRDTSMDYILFLLCSEFFSSYLPLPLSFPLSLSASSFLSLSPSCCVFFWKTKSHFNAHCHRVI